MRREKWLMIVAGFVTVAGSSAYSQQISALGGYLTKFTIEEPAKKILAEKTAGPASADITKTVRIEKPTSAILAHNTTPVPANGKAFVNPKVQPGEVRWHPSFELACETAKKSGKPVLLFQMMGKLDDQFC
jgi:hypothetical protein